MAAMDFRFVQKVANYFGMFLVEQGDEPSLSWSINDCNTGKKIGSANVRSDLRLVIDIFNDTPYLVKNTFWYIGTYHIHRILTKYIDSLPTDNLSVNDYILYRGDVYHIKKVIRSIGGKEDAYEIDGANSVRSITVSTNDELLRRIKDVH